jgi:hypothetical protein
MMVVAAAIAAVARFSGSPSFEKDLISRDQQMTVVI